jgi:hypothetical protein
LCYFYDVHVILYYVRRKHGSRVKLIDRHGFI